MTIDGLNALTTLTAGDELPVWDVEASAEEPTKKITAQNMAASVKSLGSLIGTGDLDSTPTQGSNKAVTSGGTYTAIQQSTAFTETQLGATGYTEQVTYAVKKAIKQAGRVTIQLSCSFAINLPSSTAIAIVPEGYRPNANVLVPAVIVTSADAILFDYAIVQSGGNIIQQATNNCRKVYICADYAL